MHFLRISNMRARQIISCDADNLLTRHHGVLWLAMGEIAIMQWPHISVHKEGVRPRFILPNAAAHIKLYDDRSP